MKLLAIALCLTVLLSCDPTDMGWVNFLTLLTEMTYEHSPTR